MRRRTRIANSTLLRQYVRDMRKRYRNRDFKLEDQLLRTKRGRQQVNLLWNGYSPWKYCPMLDQMKRITRRGGEALIEACIKTADGKIRKVTARSVMQALASKCIDPHTEAASVMFGVPPSEVTTEQRKLGKTANFEFLYGGPREVKLDVLKSRAPKYYPIHFGEKL